MWSAKLPLVSVAVFKLCKPFSGHIAVLGMSWSVEYQSMFIWPSAAIYDKNKLGLDVFAAVFLSKEQKSFDLIRNEVNSWNSFMLWGHF